MASSAVALGIMPGSVKEVWNSEDMTKINKRPPNAGIAGVKCTAKKGQLWVIYTSIKAQNKDYNIYVKSKTMLNVGKRIFTLSIPLYWLSVSKHVSLISFNPQTGCTV